MAKQSIFLSQTSAFATELIRLNRDVTAKDKQRALDVLKISRYTVSSYLNGKVRDCDTAAALILFFKGCIAKRNLVLLDQTTQPVTT